MSAPPAGTFPLDVSISSLISFAATDAAHCGRETQQVFRAAEFDHNRIRRMISMLWSGRMKLNDAPYRSRASGSSYEA
ncbi:hypothetical protein PQR10_02350 [Paraburkholderia phytofirmans]